MQSEMNEVRTFCVATGSAMLAILQPYTGSYMVIFLVLLANCIFGVLADRKLGNKWDKRKLIEAAKEAMIFLAIAFLLAGTGFFLGDETAARTALSIEVYSIYYFYGTNITRNGQIITREGSPANKCFRWFYYLLSFEFMKMFPAFRDYQRDSDNNNGHGPQIMPHPHSQQ